MGSTSGANDFAFPPWQAYRFSSLDFVTNNFDKISLLDLVSNKSGRDHVVSALFGIPNTVEIYSEAYASELASNHSEESSSSTHLHGLSNNAATTYPQISMCLPPLLPAMFGPRSVPPPPPAAPSKHRHNSAMSNSKSREVGVLIQPLDSCSITKIVNDLSYLDGYTNFDTESVNSSEYDDDYTPLFFGVFMAGATDEDEQTRFTREREEERAKIEQERLRK